MTMPRGLEVYLTQLWELAHSEWKLRQQSSFGGFLWTLLEPLLMYSVFYWLFTQWMRGTVQNYASLLIIGVVLYGFFQGATTYGMTALLRRRGILMNFIMRREILVFSSVLSVAMSFLLEFAIVLAFVAVIGRPLLTTWLFLPFIIGLEFVLVLGLSLHLSVLATRYSDFERIWRILTTAGFFLTPVFYSLDVMSESRRRWIRLNPVAQIIELTRDCVVRGLAPDWNRAGILLLLCCALVMTGYMLFKRYERRFSDYVSA
ncbi:MAG: ABC transporter permease [Elusimicrobia bacterium]|nr:ABC transporter permease [Elusimicrobiota bacterium]